jgi:hypothetical protein
VPREQTEAKKKPVFFRACRIPPQTCSARRTDIADGAPMFTCGTGVCETEARSNASFACCWRFLACCLTAAPPPLLLLPSPPLNVFGTEGGKGYICPLGT